MIRPEEIAREAARALVRVEEFAIDPLRPGETWRWLFVADLALAEFVLACESTRLGAAALPGVLRAKLAAAVLAAIERWARQAPPGGLPEARLAEVREAIGGFVEQERRDYGELLVTTEMVADLLAHVDHLTRVLGDCAADGSLSAWREVYDRAYAAGALAQHEADSARALGSAEKGRDGPHFLAACAVAYVVRETPLVTPPESEP